MGLRCACPQGHILNIKKELEGKQGICPECGASFLIQEITPQQGKPTALSKTGVSSKAVSTKVQTTQTPPNAPLQNKPEPVVEVPEPVEWRLANPQGEQFGPTVPTLFAQWINQGRVPPDWLVWRTGWSEWRRADEAEAELPALLPTSLPSETPPPLAAPVSQDLIASSAATNESKSSNPSTSEIPQPSPVNEYAIRRKRAVRRQRTVIAMLGTVTLVLIGVLIWIAMNSSTG